MKKRILKLAVPFFMVAVLVAATVYPLTSSQAAAKKTTYKVVIQNGSPEISLASINDGVAAPQIGKYDGSSFKMVVTEKATTEKVKSTGGTATYYPVTILAKTFKGPSSSYLMPGGGTTIAKTLMAKDAVGKLYLSGGDVDVSQIQGEKKATTKIGDGKEDPAYSLVIPVDFLSTMAQDGKVYMSMKQSAYMTTGIATITASGVKGGLNGKALPANDTTKTLPNPLVGVPLDLEKGTGTIVGVTGIMNVANKVVGSIDQISAQKWILQISK
jgi:hypothetical protein